MKQWTRRDFIKTGAVASAGLYLGVTLSNSFDIVILNGSVADGLGGKLVKTDIGIKGNRIKAIGDLSSASSDVTIDALNKIVSPGFIDIHTHTDTELIVNGNAESKIRQGVTTEVSGQCGSSPFPLTDSDAADTQKYIYEKYGITTSWKDIDGFLTAIGKGGISLNYVTFTGHGDLRAYVVGKNNVPPTSEQLKKMQKILRETIEQGSFGLSTGLEYAPGSYAGTDELIELNKVTAQMNAVYATHMRNEDDTLEEAVEEALRISRETGVSLQISHLKACNRANWYKIGAILEKIEKLNRDGFPVTADRYPYIAYSTGLSAFLPLWARQGETEDVIGRIEDKDQSGKIMEYTEGRGERIGGWDRVVISYGHKERNKKYEGKSIAECCSAEGVSGPEFISQLLVDDELQTGMVGFAMDEDNLKKVLASPLMMVGSDGNAVANYGKLALGKPHPRFYGSFPRVLGKYVREEKIMTFPEAVRKMSYLPAEKLGLKERGAIRKDYYADIVVFDPDRVIDKAEFSAPHRYPEGIDHVIVNGSHTIKNGEHTGARKGEVLRKS